NYWAIQGSNDGVNYTDIYVYDDVVGPWEERLQVVEFTSGDGNDFPTQTTSYEYFRFAAYNTPSNPNGAYYQVGEIEFFGTPDGVVPPIYVGGQNTIGSQSFDGDKTNKVFGEPVSGLPGWNVKLVDTETTVSDHTIAELVLDDDDGEVTFGSYDVIDLGGGGGTFNETQPYPNEVADTSMEDFAIRATADVVIPPGVYTIGFASDDGGQITIPGAFFDFALTLNNDSAEDDQIRFNGNRGHQWTTGVFEVTGEPLETTIVASMHERGGGDSFELAIIEGELLEEASPDTGWELLGDGTLGWTVKHTAAPLVTADLEASVSNARTWQFDVNGDTNTSDSFVVPNPDPAVYTSILDMDGVTIEINATGAVANGDAFKIIDADQIMGNVTITSVVAGQNWVFDAATGRACLGTCPGVSANGDYNGDGQVDAADIDAQAVAMLTPTQNLGTFDENGDGTINFEDRLAWVKNHAFGGKGTWIGDADLNGEFNSSDFVTVFGAGKYESGAAASWGEGDWDGDGVFGSGDFVVAFTDGGYEQGPRAAVSAVPEPTSFALMLLGITGAALRRRR
ncbi:MAG: PEP-CTERM sorting domain-containing protein, partial [Planctomycetales bacterium]|nr:PEP-CTERM sorting domain-containing protein [Planctomycetales bacterium]